MPKSIRIYRVTIAIDKNRNIRGMVEDSFVMDRQSMKPAQTTNIDLPLNGLLNPSPDSNLNEL